MYIINEGLQSILVNNDTMGASVSFDFFYVIVKQEQKWEVKG